MDQKNDQKNKVEEMLRTALPPTIREAVERQQAQRLKEHRRDFRATLASHIAGGFAASQRHVSIEAMALDAVEAADKILELVSREKVNPYSSEGDEPRKIVTETDGRFS